MFEFINIYNNINVNIISDSSILIIFGSIDIMICSFILNTNIMFETSKKVRKIVQREEPRIIDDENNYRNHKNKDGTLCNDMSSTYLYNEFHNKNVERSTRDV